MGVKTRRAETELKMNQPLSYSVTSATAQSLTSNFTTLFFSLRHMASLYYFKCYYGLPTDGQR